MPDTLIYPYFELVTDVPARELKKIQEQLKDRGVNPRDLKRMLARRLVSMYYSEEDAAKAEEAFDRVFVAKQQPEVIEEFALTPDAGVRDLVSLISAAGLAGSKGEARRLVDQGGVSIDGERVTDSAAAVPDKESFVLKVGKRKFKRIVRGS